MNYNRFQFILFIILFGFGLTLSSCKFEKQSFIGKWKVVSMHSAIRNELKKANHLNYYQFKSNGTYMNRFEDINYNGKWIVNPQKNVIEFKQESVTLKGTYQFNQNNLFLELEKYLSQKKDSEFGKTSIMLKKIKD